MAFASTQDAVKVADEIVAASQLDWDFYKTQKKLRSDTALREMISIQTEHAIRSANFVYRFWKAEGRQVLAVHPDLVDLVGSATSDVLHMEVMRTIPYTQPLVVFPQPLVFTWETGESLKVLGYYVYGLVSGAVDFAIGGGLALTDDPEADRFGCMLITSNHDAKGRFIDHEFDKISLSLNRTASLEELVDEAMGRFRWDEHATRRQVEELQSFMRFGVSSVLGSLLYLCSTVLDAEKPPRASVQRMQAKPIKVKIDLTKVGWRVGPAVTTHRADTPTLPTDSKPGREQPPHMRKAHFRTQWYGKGRTQKRTVLILPYWVRRDLLGIDQTQTVHHVPKPKNKA